MHVAVLPQLAAGAPTVVEPAGAHLPAGVYSLPWGAVTMGRVVSNVVVSGSGCLLAVATEDGRVWVMFGVCVMQL